MATGEAGAWERLEHALLENERDSSRKPSEMQL